MIGLIAFVKLKLCALSIRIFLFRGILIQHYFIVCTNVRTFLTWLWYHENSL